MAGAPFSLKGPVSITACIWPKASAWLPGALYGEWVWSDVSRGGIASGSYLKIPCSGRLKNCAPAL